MLKIMKKSKLRSIIKESIKELMNEQSVQPINIPSEGVEIVFSSCMGGYEEIRCHMNPNIQVGDIFKTYLASGTIMQGFVKKILGSCTGPNSPYPVGGPGVSSYTDYETGIFPSSTANYDPIFGGANITTWNRIGSFSLDPEVACPRCCLPSRWEYDAGYGTETPQGACYNASACQQIWDYNDIEGPDETPEAPTCAQIEAEDCDNPSLSMVQPCVTIDGQIPDQSYVGTAIEANNKAYLINSVSPSTSAPYGTVDLSQTGVQGCPGEGTLGIETGGVGFNYPQGWDSGDWTATFVDMILNHPNPCNFLQNQFGTFLNELFAGADGPVDFDINGNITPPGAAAVGVLQANLLMQKLVVIYELMGMTGCGPQNLEEQNVDKSSVKNIKMDPKAKAVLRKSAGKLKGLANKKVDPAVDRMQKLAGIPKDKPMDKPMDKPRKM